MKIELHTAVQENQVAIIAHHFARSTQKKESEQELQDLLLIAKSDEVRELLFNKIVLDTTKNELIFKAVERGSIELINFLNQKKIALNQEDAQGNTPLSVAVVKGNLELIKHLVSVGASIHFENKKGKYLLEHLPATFLFGAPHGVIDIATYILNQDKTALTIAENIAWLTNAIKIYARKTLSQAVHSNPAAEKFCASIAERTSEHQNKTLAILTAVVARNSTQLKAALDLPYVPSANEDQVFSQALTVQQATHIKDWEKISQAIPQEERAQTYLQIAKLLQETGLPKVSSNYHFLSLRQREHAYCYVKDIISDNIPAERTAPQLVR